MSVSAISLPSRMFSAPSVQEEPRPQYQQERAIEAYTKRYEGGRDIWTGRDLDGQDADHWLRIQEGLQEDPEG